MLRGSSFCYICLNNDRLQMNMYRTDSNKVKLLDMLTYLSFETSCIEEDIPMYICDECHKHLRAAYDLKVKCQKNNIHVRRYIFYLKQFTHPTTFTNEPIAKNQSITKNINNKSNTDELITINMDLTDLRDESDVETTTQNEQNTRVNEQESEITNTSILSKRPEFNTAYKQSQLLNIKNKTKICSVTVINQSNTKLNNLSAVLSQTRILSTRPEFNIYKNISQTNKNMKPSHITKQNTSGSGKFNSVPVSSVNKKKLVKKTSNKLKPGLQQTRNEYSTNVSAETRPEFVEFDIVSTVKLRKRGVVSKKPTQPVCNHSFKKPKMQKTTYNVKKDRKIIQRMNKCKVILSRCEIMKKKPLNSVTNTNNVEPNLTINKDTVTPTSESVEIKEETNKIQNEHCTIQNNTLLINNIPIKQEIFDDNETNITEVDLIKKPVMDPGEFSIKIEIVDDKTSNRIACYSTDQVIKLETTDKVDKNSENVTNNTETSINSVFSFSNAEFLTTCEQTSADRNNKDSEAMIEQGNCKATVGNASKDLDTCNTIDSDISSDLIIDEVASSKKKHIPKTSSPTDLKNIFKRFLKFTSTDAVLNSEQGHLPTRTVGTPAPVGVELNNDLLTVQLPNYKFPVSKRILNFSTTVDNSKQIEYEHKSLITNVSNFNSKSDTCKTAVGKPASHLRVAQLYNEHRKVLKTVGSSATVQSKVKSVKSTTVSRELPRKVANSAPIGHNLEESPLNFMTKQMQLINKYMNPLAEVGLAGITTKQTNTSVLSSSVGSSAEEIASIPAESNLTVLNGTIPLSNLEDCNKEVLEKSQGVVSASKITIEQDVQTEHTQTTQVQTSSDCKIVLKCPTCNKQFPSKLKLKKHALIHKNFYHCPICKDNFTTKTKFKLHMLIHNDCKHKCFICDTRTLTNKSLVQHYKAEHPSTKLCTKCKLIFNTDSEYLKHMKRHDAKWTCTVCNKSVGQKTFRAHMKTHERSKCSLCDKYFDTKQLNEHNCMEQWEKTYKCTECDNAFYFQPSLVKHMMVHYEMQCFICKITFSKPHAIVEHMSTHIGQNGYHCPICKFCTFSKDNMKLHMTEHNGQTNNTTAQRNTKYL